MSEARHVPSMAEVWQDIVAADPLVGQLQRYAARLNADTIDGAGAASGSESGRFTSESYDSSCRPSSHDALGTVSCCSESGSQPRFDSISGLGIQSSTRSMNKSTGTICGNETATTRPLILPIDPTTIRARRSAPNHGTIQTRGSLPRLKSLQMRQSFKEHRSFALDSFIESAKLNKVCDLGSGAYAHVEWARWKQPNGQLKDVAVKRLKTHLINNDQELQEFVSEGQCLKRLRNPNIVEFVGLGFHSHALSDAVQRDSMFIVQEFMNAGTLKLMVLEQMVSHCKAVYTFCDALRWMTQVAQGLEYLHTLPHKIIHRDLKLENVLLSEDQDGVLNAKLADFGLHAIVMANDRDSTVQRIKFILERGISSSNGSGGGDNVTTTTSSTSASSRNRLGDKTVQRLDSMLLVSGPNEARVPPHTFRPPAINRSVSAGMAARSPTLERSLPTDMRRSVSAVHPSLRDRLRDIPEASPSVSSGCRAASIPRSKAQLADSDTPGNSASTGQQLTSSSSAGGTQSPGRLQWLSNPPAESSSGLEGAGEPLATFPAPVSTPQADAGSRGWDQEANGLAPPVGMQKGPAGAPRGCDLTGQTGSYLYMAPEVMRNAPYNEKADIFSMAQVMFEVFAKSITSAAILTTGSVEECEMYAWKVAQGYRRPIPTWWPPPIARLIVEASSADPNARPSAHKIVQRLRDMSSSGIIAAMDGIETGDNSGGRARDTQKCCCIQ